MKSVKGFRPVAINVGVRNIEEAIEFYEGAFGAKLDIRESDGRPAHARWQFGAGDSFFFFNMRERAADDPHREHISAFGFNVADLEETHRRAIAAGAKEHFAPMDAPGLPRHSRLEDPSGNRIVLWQA
ncbi:MAG: VOC family protein [Chloroflexota bacterium]|nr:VOC family protein [Chloroflexota bacterium]